MVAELPTDAQMEAMRKRGAFLCRCPEPDPEPVYGSLQCRLCLRKISGT
jgi:hypothetical protein